MLALVVVVLAALVLLEGGLIGYTLVRLHDAEEALAVHELALGHLTAPPVSRG